MTDLEKMIGNEVKELPPTRTMQDDTKILAKSIHPYYLFTFSLIIFLAFLLGVTASMPTGAGAA